MGISTTLDSAMRALLAQQYATDTTSHNIANATTPGYSRQRVRLAAVPGANAGTSGSQPGGGVQFLGIERIRDTFVDFQIRGAMQSAGQSGARARSLQGAELTFQEPSDAGLHAVMDQFFNAWRDLATNPESSAARTNVVQTGATFATTAQRLEGGLQNLRTEADQRIQQGVNDVNALATSIAKLNGQIQMLRATGDPAADLTDQRDQALDSLSKIVDITYREQPSGSVDVQLGGHSLVAAGQAFSIYTTPNVANNNYVDIHYTDGNALVPIANGELKGLLTQRDVDLTKRITDVNTLVGQVITSVNNAHSTGFGLDGLSNRAFFTGVDASNIAVDPAVSSNPNAVAASATAAGIPGDGSNASVMSDLQYQHLMGGGTATFDEYYAGLVADVGAASRDAASLDQAQQQVQTGMQQLRDSAAGVNLDEEMIQLTTHQRAYQAAARVITIADDMLNTLINRMAS